MPVNKLAIIGLFVAVVVTVIYVMYMLAKKMGLV